MNPLRQKGFTIIELLVVVFIIALFPAIVISNFSQIKLQFSLSRAAYQFAQNVKKVQDLSLSSVDYQDSFGVVQPISGYGVYLDLTSLGDKQYIIYADKNPGSQQYDSLDYITEAVDFTASEPGIVIKEIQNTTGPAASINFSPPKPVTTITPLAQDQTSVNIVFALESDPQATKTVSINSAGLIEVR